MLKNGSKKRKRRKLITILISILKHVDENNHTTKILYLGMFYLKANPNRHTNTHGGL